MWKHYSEEASISSWQGFVQFQARFEASRNWVFRGANPFRMNQRLTVQQGAFLLPLDITVPFMENLERTLSETSEISKVMKVKLVLHEQFLNEALVNLHHMNVTRAALFPGLDGFAGYLKMLTKFPNAIHTNTDRYL